MNEMFIAKAKESTVNTVINRIKQLLIEKKLHKGDKLPNEMELSEGLNVSRGSVREAMKILEALGVIEIKVGNGTYIVDKPKDNLMDPLLFSFLLHNPDLTELSEFRKLFEMNIIQLIIDHYDENEKERSLLHANLAHLKKLQEMDVSPEVFAENDMEFHTLLGEAAHNHLAKKIYAFIMDFYRSSIMNSHDHQKTGYIAYKCHMEVLNAISQRDVELSKNAIEISVNSWKELQDDQISS